ncbi:Spc7-domain-containing protein [Sodiomyces alkalinus F11]|uniref:Spc7-domain-containing protein n=1 Tax=Sodiomyces alkalinus (strain CBS 110278 / VKM F-3762 / F11) TaxID=1314773 RepID=A0A3N2PYB0_SODAK|nr:Spc7-domain-containing protein [Sodiomyces alkalinus F11]ROT39335.1 Spc7-domain-containing protein [Sodiomyces alkalinus F11]
MASFNDATVPAARRQRKSIDGQIPSSRMFEKENATVDLGSTLAANRKKSRSKSMGPGGLDILKSGNGNRRASLAAPSRPPPRSILKPTIGPLPEIPSLKTKKSNPADSRDGQDGDREEGSESKIALRTEEEQQAAAREREERERREARRKSLANRRVSFAAEATLHTFHEVEYMQDPTSSTDSTRRRSSIVRSEANQSSDAASRPHGEVEDPTEPPQHQRKRRRSSSMGPASLHHSDDEFTASSFYSSDSEPVDAVEEVQSEEDSDVDSSSDSDADDGTMVTVEDHEVTSASVTSGFTARFPSSPGDNNTLEEALRMASTRAGTQRLDQDDSDGEEVIPSFGWIKKNKPTEQEKSSDFRDVTNNLEDADKASDADEQDMDMDMDMEMTQAAGGIIRQDAVEDEEEEQDMSMDVTHALGGILAHAKGEKGSGAEATMQVDETMELTRAIGGIRRPAASYYDDDDDGNEDMSMEITTALGGLLAANQGRPDWTRRKSTVSTAHGSLHDTTMDMDMTVAVGKILPAAGTDNNEDEATMGMDKTTAVGRILPSATVDDEGEATMGMEMTTAIGGIIKGTSTPESRVAAKKFMEAEVDRPDPPSKSTAIESKSPTRSIAPAARPASHTAGQQSPAQNPFRGAGLRRSLAQRRSPTPESSPFKGTPSPVGSTFSSRARTDARSPTRRTGSQSPSREHSSPTRTSPSRTRASGGRTKLPDGKPATPSPRKTANKASDIFRDDPNTGTRTPTVVLTPQPRRHSGVGADKPGLGSPRVAAIFDRRGSIGETAESFVPGTSRGVTFADPREMEEGTELDHGVAPDSRSRNRNEGDPKDDGDGTLNLKDMIESMSPKKKPLRGRKSLHVGSAMGLLGKRPAELDEEDEAEEMDGVKRLKGHQGSPVKNVKLQQPPSMAETTGRRVARPSQHRGQGIETRRGTTPSPVASPEKEGGAVGSSQGRGHPHYGEDDASTQPVDSHRSQTSSSKHSLKGGHPAGDRIHLQDFLNMTSIRFMELTTTKRRHTQAPDALKDGIPEGEDHFPLERCVVAGACTVPMLELYQHSCRELKKYISEGRRIVREIEAETLEDNPPLFREYMSAAAEFKSVLDNQFKNSKTHARLESKAMWYDWRTALQEGLREGLQRIAEGMGADAQLFRQQEKLLASVVPGLVARFEELAEERGDLEAVARDLADSDPAELEAVRAQLRKVDEDVEEKRRRVRELRQQLQESEEDVEQLSARKNECLADIRESEKIREECRGWSTGEIISLQERVDEMEKQYGWAITGTSGTTISMAYKRDIELVFNVSSLQRDHKNAQIDLWYVASNRETGAEPSKPSTAESEFFLQCIRDHVRALPQSPTKIPDLLRTVRTSWDLAVSTRSQIRRINTTFPTTVVRTSDSSIAICSSLLLVPIETRVEVSLHVQAASRPDGVEFSLHPQARVVYGETFNAGKMSEFLSTHLGEMVRPVGEGAPSWCDVLVDLHERLLARGRK